MVIPSDLIPALVEYGNIANNFLRKYLTDAQISDYLDYLNDPATTHGEAFRRITVEHGHTESVFYAVDALGRVNALCNAAECPSKEPLEAGRAFIVAFSALQAGMMIGAVVDDKGREAIINLAAHGAKFAGSGGRKPGRFSQLLESIVREYYRHNHDFPDYMEVVSLLNNEIGKGIVNSVDETEGIDHGASGSIGIPALKNKLSEIRKKIESP